MQIGSFNLLISPVFNTRELDFNVQALNCSWFTFYRVHYTAMLDTSYYRGMPRINIYLFVLPIQILYTAAAVVA